MTDYGKTLRPDPTPIPGLLVWDLPVHGDNRGWFKENWQREKMVAAGLPVFGPVQNNVSFNDAVGRRAVSTPSPGTSSSRSPPGAFSARGSTCARPTFGTVFTAELDPSRAVFVPRGVGNAFRRWSLTPPTSTSSTTTTHPMPITHR